MVIRLDIDMDYVDLSFNRHLDGRSCAVCWIHESLRFETNKNNSLADMWLEFSTLRIVSGFLDPESLFGMTRWGDPSVSIMHVNSAKLIHISTDLNPE